MGLYNCLIEFSVSFFYQIKTDETLLNAGWKFPMDSAFSTWHFLDQIAIFFLTLINSQK